MTVREPTAKEREWLQVVFETFVATVAWPKEFVLQVELDRRDVDLNLVDVAQELPRELGYISEGQDPQARVTVRGVSFCTGSERLLGQFMTAVQLTELRAGSIELVTSPHLLVELESVLRRPKFRRYVTLDEVAVFVELIRAESVIMDDPEPPARPLRSDPGDEYIVTLARSAKVDALVSGDPHLTRLRKIIPVRTPSELLTELRGDIGDRN